MLILARAMALGHQPQMDADEFINELMIVIIFLSVFICGSISSLFAHRDRGRS
jgi:hypothetical protein